MKGGDLYVALCIYLSPLVFFHQEKDHRWHYQYSHNASRYSVLLCLSANRIIHRLCRGGMGGYGLWQARKNEICQGASRGNSQGYEGA